MFARALLDYKARTAPEGGASEMSFRQGDILRILAKPRSGWWGGVIEGRGGWVPSDHFQIITVGVYETERDKKNESQNAEGHETDEDGKEASEDEEVVALEGDNYWIPITTPDGRLYYFNTL